MSKVLSFLMAVLLLLPPMAAVAQGGDTVKLNSERAGRLDNAADLVQDGDLNQALEIYDEMLGEVELDLLYLNRGRVLQHLGRCKAARAAFDKVEGAPRLVDVEKKTIRVPLAHYIEELERTCNGDLQVACAQEGMRLSIEGRLEAEVRCGQSIELPAGQWVVVGALHGQQVRTTASVRGTQLTRASVGLSPQGLTGAARVLLAQGHHAKAQALLEEALRTQETQEIYLYIAEALMGQGRCQLAYVSIEEVTDAPPSSALSPLQFAQHLDVFQQGFREVCGERVRVRCTPAEMTLRIDEGPPQVCSPAPIFLSVGTHRLVGSLPARDGELSATISQEVSIKAGEVNEVNLVLVDESLFGPVGWTGVGGVGLGLALLTSAVLIDRLALVPRDEAFERDKRDGVPTPVLAEQLDDIESLQQTNLVLTGAGLSLVLIGGGLMLTDVFWIDEPTLAEKAGVSLQLGGEQIMVFWEAEWH